MYSLKKIVPFSAGRSQMSKDPCKLVQKIFFRLTQISADHADPKPKLKKN